jgi:hypothetical protein
VRFLCPPDLGLVPVGTDICEHAVLAVERSLLLDTLISRVSDRNGRSTTLETDMAEVMLQ